MADRIPWPDGAAWRGETVIEGVPYRFRGRWNVVGEFWTLDILTGDDVPLAIGEKVTLGKVLFARVADPRLPTGSIVAVATDNRTPSLPGRDDFASGRARLIHVPLV